MSTFTTDGPGFAAPALAAIRRTTTELANRRAEWRARHAMIARLGGLKPHNLRDIGLTESDISSVAGMPSSQDTSDALHRASLTRAGNY